MVNSRWDGGGVVGEGKRAKEAVGGSILSRITAGDRAAVEECINSYGGLVWSLARRLSRSEADAEDAVQEIFIDVWRSAARFDEAQGSEVTFVAMIARRRMIDRLRQAQRHPVYEPPSEEMIDARRHDREVERSADAALAARAMEELRPEQRRVLRLAVCEGFTHQEIASATGMPLGTVKTHVRRGLAQIRAALGLRIVDGAKESAR
jgi:RNA polymerase sigma-70 factor (ECF subfamily)